MFNIFSISFQSGLIFNLSFSLPSLRRFNPFIELIKDWIYSLYIIEAGFNLLNALRKSIVSKLEFFVFLPIFELSLETRFYQIQHTLLHVCFESVVVHFLVGEVLATFLLTLNYFFKGFLSSFAGRI